MEIDGKVFFPIRGILYALGIGSGILLILIYVLYQARFLTEGPVITLLKEPSTTLSTSTIELTGRAQNIVSLSMNGRTIYTTDEGVFSETLTLPIGYTIVTIEGVDRYGKRERIERSIVYTPI